MSSDHFHLRENSQIYINKIIRTDKEGNISNPQLAILRMKENNQVATICEIPYPEWLDEVEENFRDPNMTRLVTCTNNQDQPGTKTLDFFSINLSKGSTYRGFLDEPITISSYYYRIYPGIYFYKDLNKQPYLTNAYHQTIALNRCFPELGQKVEIKIDGLEDGIKEPTQEGTLKYPNIKELRVSIGSVETLYILIKLPINPNEEFLVFKYIRSRMTGLEYALWDDEEIFKPLSYNLEEGISKTGLDKEIISRTKLAKQVVGTQGKIAKLKLLQRLKSTQQS